MPGPVLNQLGCGLRPAASGTVPESVVDLLPDSGAAPEPEIVIYGAVMRQQFPGTTTANGIEDAVEDLAAALFWRTVTAFDGSTSDTSDSHFISVGSVS
jgi:hypothetical protein